MSPKKKNTDEVSENFEERLDTLVQATNKRFGENTLMFLGRTPSISSSYKTWSTNLFRLDNVLGNFGVVRGRFIEIWGEESSGKTTTMLQLIANVQKIGGVCAYIDGEHTLDPEYASKIGVNVDNLLICQPDNGAQGLNVVDVLVQSGLLAVIVVDSVPSLIPEEMMDKNIGDATIGLLARLMGPASRLLVKPCEKSNTNILWINQVREVIDIGGMPSRGKKKLNRPGGREFRHNLSYSLFIKYIGQIKDSSNDNARIGHDIQCEVIKNKCNPPYKKTTMRIMYDEKRNLWGVNEACDLYFTCLEYGLINVSGTKKTFMKKHELTNFGIGELNTIHHISEDKELQKLMRQTLRELIGYPEPFYFDKEQASIDFPNIEDIKLTRITDTISKETGIKDSPVDADKDVQVDDESDFMKKLQEAISNRENQENKKIIDSEDTSENNDKEETNEEDEEIVLPENLDEEINSFNDISIKEDLPKEDKEEIKEEVVLPEDKEETDKEDVLPEIKEETDEEDVFNL